MDIVNTDFVGAKSSTKEALSPQQHLFHLASGWEQYRSLHPELGSHEREAYPSRQVGFANAQEQSTEQSAIIAARRTALLMHRNVLNYSRNLLAYGIRRAFNF